MINSTVAANINNKIANLSRLSLRDSLSLYGDQPSTRNEALPVLVLDSPLCYAEICLQGAQLLRFTPRGQQPWLWLSPYNNYCHGQPIRGGIPLCLPWFGVHPEQAAAYPKHGFVRNQTWQLDSAHETPLGLQLAFRFEHQGSEPKSLFAQSFSAHLGMHLGDHIELTLTIKNLAATSANFSWAMHSYFCVDHLTKVQVSGLEDQQYLDNTDALRPMTQHGKITFNGEVDRAYLNTTGKQTIYDSRQITIAGKNCPSCIVWNPGHALAATIKDITDSYDQYVCVERGCAFSDGISLAPQQYFSSSMTITKNL